MKINAVQGRPTETPLGRSGRESRSSGKRLGRGPSRTTGVVTVTVYFGGDFDARRAIRSWTERNVVGIRRTVRCATRDARRARCRKCVEKKKKTSRAYPCTVFWRISFDSGYGVSGFECRRKTINDRTTVRRPWLRYNLDRFLRASVSVSLFNRISIYDRTFFIFSRPIRTFEYDFTCTVIIDRTREYWSTRNVPNGPHTAASYTIDLPSSVATRYGFSWSRRGQGRHLSFLQECAKILEANFLSP